MKKHESKCPAMRALPFPLDRQGTLHVDGAIHSTGLFHADLKSGLYVASLQYSQEVPSKGEFVLMADDKERIGIERIYPCPVGEAHHHFDVEPA